MSKPCSVCGKMIALARLAHGGRRHRVESQEVV